MPLLGETAEAANAPSGALFFTLQSLCMVDEQEIGTLFGQGQRQAIPSLSSH